MENPVDEIPSIIRSLTQAPPLTQKETVYKYFTTNASFTHPFCRTGSFHRSDHLNSRILIHAIYRWYKIMSPRIDLEVGSVAYDEATLTLYVSLTQTFRVAIIPFYRAPVKLVTVLQLAHDGKSNKYRIQSQNDLYQINEFVRFFWFGGWMIVGVAQILVTVFCTLAAMLLTPQTYVQDKWVRAGWKEIIS